MASNRSNSLPAMVCVRWIWPFLIGFEHSSELRKCLSPIGDSSERREKMEGRWVKVGHFRHIRRLSPEKRRAKGDVAAKDRTSDA